MNRRLLKRIPEMYDALNEVDSIVGEYWFQGKTGYIFVHGGTQKKIMEHWE